MSQQHRELSENEQLITGIIFLAVVIFGIGAVCVYGAYAFFKANLYLGIGFCAVVVFVAAVVIKAIANYDGSRGTEHHWTDFDPFSS